MLAISNNNVSHRVLAASVEEPFYYLQNFETVARWVLDRYSDLLEEREINRLRNFFHLPQNSRALLTRMVMRKGNLFRASKLNYVEIGKTRSVLKPLLTKDWIVCNPELSLSELFELLTKDELSATFTELPRHGRKSAWLDMLTAHYPHVHTFEHWCSDIDDIVVTLIEPELFDRIRLLFFGNLHQDWSEFVLADLGIYLYEDVALTAEARAFQSRCDIEHYEVLYHCREAIEEENSHFEKLLQTLLSLQSMNSWILRRRSKVLFKLGQRCEKLRDWKNALTIYQKCEYPGARVRLIRVLERLEQFKDALALANQAANEPESDAEHQQVLRMLPRLRRHAGEQVEKYIAATPSTEIELTLPQPTGPYSVEMAIQQLLHHEDGPAFYVENTLINALFGLLCWDAIFAPIPGAFFHPFQAAPADLLHPEFHASRKSHFDELFAQFDSGSYKQTIYERYKDKQWIQSPFVHWALLSEELLQLALTCIPAHHLRALFTRILQDIKINRSGLPDLIQFWPREQRYQMIEVKGPGDRLQDNQKRWLNYCALHEIPTAVCYVQWQS